MVTSKDEETGDSLIDISHESLIRQWERLENWAKEEAEFAKSYHNLKYRASKWAPEEEKDEEEEEKEADSSKSKDIKGGELLTGLDLDNALDWKKCRKPNLAWARLYRSKNKKDERSEKDEFDRVIKFLRRSSKKRRRDWILTFAGSVITLIIILLVSWEIINTRREETQRTQNLFESYLSQSSQQARIENFTEASRIFDKSHELDSKVPSERRHARNLMSWFVNLMSGSADKTYKGTGAALWNVAVSSDGYLLAAVGQKGTVLLFDAESGELLKSFQGHEPDKGDVWGVAFHPDNKWLVTGGEDGQIIFWDLSDRKKILRCSTEEVHRWSAPAEVYGLALSPDGNLLASGGTDKNIITIWDVNTGDVLQILKGHEGNVFGLGFSPDGERLASASYDKTAIIWNLETGEPLHILKGHLDKVVRVAFHPNGGILATSSLDKSVRLWDVESGEAIDILNGHGSKIFGLAFFDSGRRLVSASHDRTLRIWDTDSGVMLKVLQGHIEESLGVTATDDYILSASKDGTLQRWDIYSETGESMELIDMPYRPYSVAIAPDGSKVAVGFDNGRMGLYALPDVYEIWEQEKAHSDRVTSLAFSSDGKYLATASLDRRVSLWNASNGELEYAFANHSDHVYGVAFSPTRKFIASASSDGRIGLLEIDKKDSRFHKAHEGNVFSVTFNATGQKLLSTGSDGKTRLWDIRTWPPESKDFPTSRNAVYEASFSPDGNNIAIAGYDPTVRIFKTDGTEEQSLIGHKHLVFVLPSARTAGRLPQ